MKIKNCNPYISNEIKILEVFNDYQKNKETFKVTLSKLIGLGIKRETAIKCLYEPAVDNPLDANYQKKLINLFFNG